MNKSLILGLIFLISCVLTVPIISLPAVAQQVTYSFSGYVLDSNGNGVAGAQVNFNGVIPNAATDTKGYYTTTAPAGTYQIYVWPPFDSNYVNYAESGIVVSGNILRNLTLQTGFKVSGYITDSSGSPMVGASVLFKSGSQVYGSGWYSKSNGYYYISVPAGTYTIDAHPQTAFNPSFTGPCTPFTTYYEYNYAVNANTNKNITVNSSPNPTPQSTSQPTPAPTNPPTQNPTPSPTPAKPALPTTQISISTEGSTYQVGSTLSVKGKLTDLKGNALNDKTVILSSSLDGGVSWEPVGSGKTDTEGQYSVQWLIQASGTFKLKAEWAGSNSLSGSSVTTAVSFLPIEDQTVFFVESNSTVTALKFDSENHLLSFNVTGETGTKGQTQVTVAKTLVANAADLTVSLDGKQMVYTVTSSADYWILEFTYNHSTHQVTINTAAEANQNPATDNTLVLVGIVAVIAIVALAGVLVFRKSHKEH